MTASERLRELNAYFAEVTLHEDMRGDVAFTAEDFPKLQDFLLALSLIADVVEAADDAHGSFVAYWTDMPQEEVERLRVRLIDALTALEEALEET